MPERLLTIDSLRTEFPTRQGVVRAVDGVSLDVRRGECLGVVGESGSGKSVTFASVMRLVRPPGRIVAGTIVFDGRELTQLDDAAMRRLRGKDMAMTMQDALTALNPAFRVGTQIVEVLRAHDDGGAGRSREAARRRAVELLKMVGIPDAERRVDDYPHQFSGGMRQRVMIAIALACRPKLLIADEPTTALDVTVQAQVLELIAELRAALGMSVVLITHDLGIVADYCDRVAVMYAGQVVETGPTMDVLHRPVHPYTSGLLRAVPRLERLTDPVRPIPGQMPDPSVQAATCRFLPRCGQRRAACAVPVDMRQLGGGRAARCILAEPANAH
jgi:oligopeptide/dipeptide ABC transporter ATP-binding protein